MFPGVVSARLNSASHAARRRHGEAEAGAYRPVVLAHTSVPNRHFAGHSGQERSSTSGAHRHRPCVNLCGSSDPAQTTGALGTSIAEPSRHSPATVTSGGARHRPCDVTISSAVRLGTSGLEYGRLGTTSTGSGSHTPSTRTKSAGRPASSERRRSTVCRPIACSWIANRSPSRRTGATGGATIW